MNYIMGLIMYLVASAYMFYLRRQGKTWNEAIATAAPGLVGGLLIAGISLFSK